jgi:hypothetical protein
MLFASRGTAKAQVRLLIQNASGQRGNANRWAGELPKVHRFEPHPKCFLASRPVHFVAV